MAIVNKSREELEQELREPMLAESERYRNDLKLLIESKKFNPRTISDMDIIDLQTFCISYGMNVKLTRGNYYELKGKLVWKIRKLQRKLTDLIAEKSREELPGRKSIEIKKQKTPESIERS